MTTVQTILDRGFGLSRFSRPELIAQQTDVLVQVVNRTQMVLFQFAARVNPLLYSAQFSVPITIDVTGRFWIRPANAESVFRIEGEGVLTTPSFVGEVLVVPFDDRPAFASSPSVYRLADRFYPSGNPLDPTDGSLRFFYARRPDALTSPSSTLDVGFLDAFHPILEFEVAAFNARADGGRDGELETMVRERDRHVAVFEAFLEHETVNESRRFGEQRWFATERRKPLESLTAAGA